MGPYSELGNTISEIGLSSSYVNFGYENLQKFFQELGNELEIRIKRVREYKDFPARTSDMDIIKESYIIRLYEEDLYNEDRDNPWLGVIYNDDQIQYFAGYYQIFYEMFIVMMYSCIEKGLVSFCGLTKEQCFKSILPQVRTILQEKLEKNIEYEIWEELFFIKDIRNRIIHTSLTLERDLSNINYFGDNFEDLPINANPKLIKYLQTKTYDEERGSISLDLEYCKYLSKFAEGFFLKIDEYSSKNRGIL